MKYCQHCGKKLLNNAKFCQYCGAKQNNQPQDSSQGHQEYYTERHQFRSYLDDDNYWYNHGFFTSVIQANFIYRLMWSMVIGLVAMVAFLIPSIKVMDQSLFESQVLLIIGIFVGIALIIITLNRHWLMFMNHWLTIRCYRIMHRHHPEYDMVTADRIVNHRIQKFDSIAWKVILGLIILGAAYFMIVLILGIIVILVVFWVIDVLLGPRWHFFPSHWY